MRRMRQLLGGGGSPVSQVNMAWPSPGASCKAGEPWAGEGQTGAQQRGKRSQCQATCLGGVWVADTKGPDDVRQTRRHVSQGINREALWNRQVNIIEITFM